MICRTSNSSLMIIIIMIFTIGVVDSDIDSGRCHHSCGSITLRYPFGFSAGCPVLFNCSKTPGAAKIGEFIVKNVTETSVYVGVPPKCNRSVDSLASLFGEHHAPSWQNSLLLQNCSKSLNNCLIKQSYVENQLNLTRCDPRGDDDISCFSSDLNSTNIMRYDDVKKSHCGLLYSSIAFESVGEKSGVALEFEQVQLKWWLKGGCENNHCSENATCTPVYHLGHRCSCAEGFAGDGYVHGSRCRRVCHGSGSINCHFGGTKLGVLVGAVNTSPRISDYFIGIIAGASLIAGLALLFYCIRRRSASLKSLSIAKRRLCETAGNSRVPFFPYKEIEKATNGFSERQRLGTGAYGTVYAGKLQNDEWVAIKRLRHRDTDSVDQVMNEIKLLSSVSHPNLVRLLGCCIEQGEPVLVYEFMPNGTLSQHLQRERGNGLPWTVRLNIATQTAKAITYLHSAMNPPIYHRDIKSSNILLDYSFNSKVADFGLSRLGLVESSHISTAPQGTPGYLDPQYHQYFHLSDKSDVYSFGVVLVEVITALKVVDFNRPHSEVNLAALAIDRIGRDCVDEIIDPTLEPNRDAWTLSSIHKVAELAFRCLAFHRDMRPNMMEVAQELEQIRLGAWVPNMCMESPTSSQCSFSEYGSQRSLGGVSVKKSSVGSTRVVVPQKPPDCLTSLEEISDGSPVSIQDPWLSEQSSPSENSLLGNVAR